MVENRYVFIPLHSTPPLKGPRRNIVITFGTAELEWCVYPKVKTFDDMFMRFDTIPACDGQTDRQTDGHLATASMKISRYKQIRTIV